MNLKPRTFTMTADDGTQDRTIEAIEKAMAAADVSNREMATCLGLSESQWSNVKAGRQVLAPWMQRKISKRLGTAAPVASQYILVTGESIGRSLGLPAVDAASSAIDVTVLGGQLLRRLHDAGRDGRYDSVEQGQIFPLVRELGRLLDAIDAKVASGRA